MLNEIQKPFEFEYVENTQVDKLGIKITSGEFSGLVVSFGQIAFDEDLSECVMRFDYDIEVGEVSEHSKQILEQALGDVIVYTLTQAAKENKLAELLGGE